MMFGEPMSPPATWPTLITAVSIAWTLRLTTVCRPMMNCASTIVVSVARCAPAPPWPPDPSDVQGGEVGSQPDRSLAGALAAQRADDAGLGDALDDVDAPRPQPIRDDFGGSRFLEPGLGMPMDIMSDFDQFGFEGLQLVDDSLAHRCRLSCRWFARTHVHCPAFARIPASTAASASFAFSPSGPPACAMSGRPPPPLPPNAAEPRRTRSTALKRAVMSAVTATTRLPLPSSPGATNATDPDPRLALASSASDFRSFISTPVTARA